MNARDIVNARGGKWMTNYGLTSCPVCQPEMRKDQIGLSVSDKNGRLLMKCHKGNCDYVSILKGVGAGSERSPGQSDDDRKARVAEDLRRALSGRATAKKVMGASRRRIHPYTSRKGFPRLEFPTISIAELKRIIKIPMMLGDLHPDDMLLCVPMRTEDGELRSVEFISGSGVKCFLPGGKLKKTACWMGKEGPVVLCEGVATGLSLWRSAASQELAIRVACAGSASNMLSLRGVASFVMADNDESGAGRKAALDVGKPFTMPPIVGTDFNDFELAIPSEARRLLWRLLSGEQSLAVRPTR